jgi:starch synthase
MKIFHLSAECYPVAKVGGLGDVVGALPKYLNKAGHEAAVVLPYYDRKFTHENQFDIVFEGSTRLGGSRYPFQVLKETTNKLGFELFLIRVPGMLDRQEVYGYPDEIEQFTLFQLTFLDWLHWSQQNPDVVHCHDHHTGLVPFLMQHSALYRRISTIPTVFTIHNGQYHGAFGWDKSYYLPEVDPAYMGLLDWRGGINPLATAVKCCYKYTTVSPSYLYELTLQSNGLEYLFWLERSKGTGIINGIDTHIWDTETDPMIAQNYNVKTAVAGKAANKATLCKRFNLSSKKPLFTFIGRLVVEKGADLLPGIIRHTLLTYGEEVSIFVLGSGEKNIEEELTALSQQFPGRCNVFIGYDESLAHQVYSGADFILMPSRVEPCGLNQLYSLRYGTVPIVRNTGGLKDTVVDVADENGYGIKFNENTTEDAYHAVWRAITLYQNAKEMQLLIKRMMELDFSWDKSAMEYINLYKSLKQQ